MTVPGVYNRDDQFHASIAAAAATDDARDGDAERVEVVAKVIFNDISGWLTAAYGEWDYAEFRDTAEAVLAALREMEGK